MKLVRNHIFEKFTEDSDPIEDMGIGYKAKLKKLQELDRYLDKSDFIDNNFISYIFKDVYDKWRKKCSLITPDNITIWSSVTDYGNPIIKVKGPGIRESTLLRGENYSEFVLLDIEKFLNSKEMKGTITQRFLKDMSNPHKLAELILIESNRKKLKIPTITFCKYLAEKLIEMHS